MMIMMIRHKAAVILALLTILVLPEFNEGRGHSYIGCYNDKGNRAMKGFAKYNDGSMTAKKCIRMCGKFKFAGTQYSKECFCSNTPFDIHGKSAERDCSKRCSGNRREMCGGTWRLSVYSVKPIVLNYLGCWHDKGNRAMKGYVKWADKSMTNVRCIAMCNARNYKYAGTQNSNECFCSNSYTRYGKAGAARCSSGCTGNRGQKCGGPWALSVYGVKSKSTRAAGQTAAKYLGCFHDKGNRDLKGFSKFNDGSMTNEKCIGMCRAKGFRYAGTQYSKECFCDRSFGSHGISAERDCNKRCSGNNRQMCGGTWRLSIYDLNAGAVKGAKYIGCFHDKGKRDLTRFSKFNDGRMTNEKCVGICRSKGFKYAGTQYSKECFCDNSYGSYGKSAARDCSKRCSGNKKQMCGGTWRLSIYELKGGAKAVKAFTGAKYIGCFHDKGKRDLKGFSKFNDGRMTNEKCIGMCRTKGFRYAGTQYSKECFCDNSYGSYGKSAARDCSKRCSGNNNQMCGGTWRLSIYELKGGAGAVRGAKYIGCFHDKGKRDLKGFSKFNDGRMTNEKCIGMCRAKGFRYAGTQYSKECFCDNSYGSYGKSAARDCSKRCSGNNRQMCGGTWRLSIYDLKGGAGAVRGAITSAWVSGIRRFSTEYTTTRFCANRVIGKPDVYPRYGDIQNAWAPRKIDAHQFLELKFPKALYISSIHIYETFNAGGVKAVKLLKPNNRWDVVWRTSTVTKITKARVFTVAVNPIRSYATRIIRLDIDCTAAKTWVEIDAVQIKGTENAVQTKGKPRLTRKPVLKTIPQHGAFDVEVNFGPDNRGDAVKYLVIWHFGGNKRGFKLKAGQHSHRLTKTQLTKFRLGQTIYAEVVACLERNCRPTQTKPVGSNKLRTDFGIPHTLTLREGQPAVDVILKAQLPPSLFCKNCRIVIHAYFSPLKELKCFDTNVYQAVIARTDQPCGVVITQKDWQKKKVFPIRATEDGLVDGTRKRYLKFYARLESGGTPIKSVLLKTVKVTIKDFKVSTSAVCYSLNDPHMKTFDSLGYNNYRQGSFILYRHKNLPQEIQAYYRSCNGFASCNCAVSVRAGDDVILVDSCGPSKGEGIRPLIVKSYVNGPMTPGLEIRRFTSGKEFRIFLPTGTYLIVKVVAHRFRQNKDTTHLNLWVKASSLDYGVTEGLCGTFDSNKNNDLKLRNGRIVKYKNQPNAFSDSWRSTEEENIYTGYCPKPGETFTDNREYCDCTAGQRASCGLNKQVFKCKDKRQTFVQKKRQGVDITDTIAKETPEGCPIGEEKTDFEFEDVDAKEPSCPTESGITDRKAEEFCNDAVRKSPSGRTCKKVQKKMFRTLIKNCRRDLCMTDDKDWAKSMLSDLTTECQIKEQTIVDLWKPNKDGDLIPDPKIDGITCPRDCSFRGKCKGGICRCDPGFMDDDCSVSVKQPPFVNGFLEGAFCDKKCKSCRTVTVSGMGFVDGRGLTCHITEVGRKDSYRVPAKFINFQTVSCKLRKAATCKVRVSNRNNIESDSITYTVYDSSCETCSEKGRFPRNDVCTIGGQCYKAGTLSPTNRHVMCFPKLNTKRWTPVTTGKKNVVATALRFNRLTGKKLVTSVGNFAVSGSPRIINTKTVGRVLQLNSNKDYVTIPSSKIFECPIKVAKCPGGFTLEFSVRIPKLCDNMVIVSSGGELMDFSGIGIFYKQGRLVATVDTPTMKWTVSVKVRNLNAFTKLSLSWSMSSGLVFTVNDKTVRKAEFCDAKQRRKKHKPSNIMRMGRAINGKSACPGRLQIGGFNLFPAEKEVVDKIGLKIVNGGWSDWSRWTPCSRRCGGGTRMKTRSCTNPRPSKGAKGCVGTGIIKKPCNTNACSVDGGWTDWSRWTVCSKKCGGGTRIQTRTCTQPRPANGGEPCAGADTRKGDCNTHPCVVDGGWTDWSRWSVCSKKCGGGTRIQTRTCTQPRPANGGEPCAGADTRRGDCNTHPCVVPVVRGRWKEWEPWTSCTKKCGGGVQMRFRECFYPAPCGGKRIKCVGKRGEARLCNKTPCQNCMEVECKSEGGDFNTCPLPRQQKPKSIEVVKSFGNKRCAVDDTYGEEDGELWVDVGCKARFKICYYD